ncbi:MAG: hypothetical protein RTU09_09665 [Candidatus Thorarchaeota archaeon]
MVYQHKSKTYAKKTKDILAENVTDSKKTEYDEIEVPESNQTRAALLEEIQKESDQNAPSRDSEEISANADEEVDAAANPMIEEDCPDYSSTQEIHFESKEAEESFEKKKKRSYVEFREEQEK